MKIIAFEQSGQRSWGAVLEDGQGVADLGARLGITLKQALEQDRLQEPAAASDFALEELTLLPPIDRPEKIPCIGVNYANRNAEYKDGTEPPKYPSVFMRTPDSLTAHNQPLLRPPESIQLDYEGEIGVVIGKPGRRIPQANALDHIAALTVVNEGTIRDWLRHAKFNVTQGKNFYHSGSVGPWLVTMDEFGTDALTDMTVQTTVNGELRQNDTTANMMFPIAYLISYLSTFFTLKPGDLIATGTPNGAGARFDPPIWLEPGDEVRVHVSNVGTLVNTIEDEPTLQNKAES